MIIEDMTEREILRQQLELMAKNSQFVGGNELAAISRAMLEIYLVLVSSDSSVEGQVQDQQELERFVPEDSNGKHYENASKCNAPSDN